MSRVLVADDDLDVGEIVALKLEAAGHHVDLVTDGLAALAASREHEYAVAVVDWMMPGMSGVDVCSAIRAASPDRPRLIMLTAKSQPDDLVAAGAAGVDEYIVKPFSPRHLAARVDALAAIGHETREPPDR